MKYSVGQILFVVLDKKVQVYPMQVVEEIRKKTLKGEVTTYVLQGGSDANSTVELDQVDGEIFESSEEVRQVLLTRVTNQITKIVESAITRSKEWYGTQPSNARDDILESDAPQSSVGTETLVTLPDGTKARLKSNLKVKNEEQV